MGGSGIGRKILVVGGIAGLVLYILALVSPWFRVTTTILGSSNTYSCWVDGTCRDSNGNSDKNNGDAQETYDSALALTIVAAVISLLALFVSIIGLGCISRAPEVPKIAFVLAGLFLLAFIFGMVAVIVFAVQLPDKYLSLLLLSHLSHKELTKLW